MTLPPDQGPPLRSPPTRGSYRDSSPDPFSPSEMPKNSISQLNLARIQTDRSDAPVSLDSPDSKTSKGPNQVLKMQRVMSMESDESLPKLREKKKSSSSVIMRRSTKDLGAVQDDAADSTLTATES